MNWQPGDILVVRPKNSDDQVKELFDIFNEHGFHFDANTIVQIKEIDAGKTKTQIFVCKLVFVYELVMYFNSNLNTKHPKTSY